MPVTITKLKGGGVKAKKTTMKKARAQKRIIEEADRNKHLARRMTE